jgi:sugar phosphate isomerase/epimerase
VHQFINPVFFIDEFADRIFHVHVKDSRVQLNGRNSILSSHLDFGDHRRGWDFVSPGRGDAKWDQIIRALNRANYQGPLSIEWEDSGMNREWGAPEALALVRRQDFAPSSVAFDAAFASR